MVFYTLTPNDFEKLTSRVFQLNGFRTFLTSETGDGGIDIEATYDGEIFKGTYLIQCKLWKANVGEPPIRDLYGAVQDRNALKGILVTSSDFSQNARSFAENKNIDLIDGETLLKLLKNTNLYDNESKTEPIFSPKVKGFLDDDSFDKQLYNLLIEEIEDNPTFEKLYMKLLELLLKATLNQGGKSKYNGLLNEIFYYSKRYKEKFTKGKSNEATGKRVGIDYICLLLNLLNGNLTQVYTLLSEIKKTRFKENISSPSYKDRVPDRYKKHIDQLENVLNQFISNKENESDTIPFTTYFYYEDSHPFAKTMITETEEITFEWIVQEFGLNENKDIERQKQLLLNIY